MLYVFNTTVLGKQYTTRDLKKLLPVTTPEYGLREDFYGGRITHIGQTDGDVLLLIDSRQPPDNQLIDLAAAELKNIPMHFIKELCRKRKIQFGLMPKKDELIAKLKEST